MRRGRSSAPPDNDNPSVMAEGRDTSAALRYAQPSVHPKGTCFAASTGPPHRGRRGVFRACGRGGAMWASPPTKSQGVRRITMGGQGRPSETLDNVGRMGIIKTRGRCDKRSTLEVNDFSQNKKPSLGRVAVSAFQLHNSNRDGVPPDVKCKRPKHSLTPFRVVWLTACRFTQRPCGQYNSAGGICQISPAGGLPACR